MKAAIPGGRQALREQIALNKAAEERRRKRILELGREYPPSVVCERLGLSCPKNIRTVLRKNGIEPVPEEEFFP